MKRLNILLAVYLIASLQLNAQNCVDTLHIKGYYVIKKIAKELTPLIKRHKDVTVIKQRIDTHYDPSFIPSDRISKKHPLSYWLNHFFDNTNQVFISCEKFSAKDFIEKKCSEELRNNKDTCLFPSLKSNVFYRTINLNTGDVFEIYYLDAYWAKVKVRVGSLEADLIPGKIAQRCIIPGIKEFDLYCFVRSDSVQINPKIKDPAIKVWKNK